MRRKLPNLAKRWAAAIAAAAVVATSLVTVGIGATPALAAPFACDSGSIYTQNAAGEVRRISVAPGNPVNQAGTVQATDQRANGLGISADGNLSYTIDNAASTNGNNKQIAIYNGLTNLTETKPLGDPDVPGVIIRGAVSPKTGIYYYGGTGANAYIGAYNPATGQAIGQVGFLPTGLDGNGDFAFGANGELYVLADRKIFVVQAADVPTTAGLTNIPLTEVATLPAGTLGNGIAFGANGRLFVSQGTTISQVNLSTGALEDTITTTGFSHTDLASCSFPNTLTLKKDVTERYAAGDQFKLTVNGTSLSAPRSETTTGSSAGVQAKFVGPLFVESGNSYSLSEAGAAGANLANYNSSLSCVNAVGASVPTTGSAPDWNLTFPTATTGDNVVCTITNDAKERPVPGLELNKSSDPASGTAVAAGDIITYTVSARNSGNTLLDPVTIADDLSQVFAFGTYQNDVVTQIDNTPVTSNVATITGDELAWTGILQPDETLSITYSIIVNDGVEGETIENRVTASGTPPGPGEPIIPPSVTTEHPIAGFQIVKTANPVSGTVVEPGSTIVYTVTGSNTGAIRLDPATITDNLAEVLAHATYNDDLVASVGSASVSGDILTWNGSLGAGEDVTVTYSVTVDDDVSSVLLKNIATGSATPQTPDPSNPDGPTIPGDPITPPQATTEHPVLGSGFVISKSADPVSGSTVSPGDTITYTVTGANTGDTVLDPATITDDLSAVLSNAQYNDDASATTGTTSITGNDLVWSGPLAVGETVTITYSVTVNGNAGGVLIENVAAGEATPQIPTDPTDPDSPTTPGSPIEPPPVTTEHPVNAPGFEIAKSANPASGTAVDPGSVITYTVTGVNTGKTALNTVDIADDMTEVLAHAVYNDDAVATIGAADGGDVDITGTDLSWTGALAVGETVTITYSVTVNGNAGGEILKNTVNATATPPGGEEITPPPVTTENPVNLPGFSLSKASDPAPGTMIDSGSVITYTVTGVNTGETALNTVDIADDMTEVLAHAVYNNDATTSIGADVQVVDTELSWTGALAVGEAVTITYSVTVNGDAGGALLKNTVNATATPPGGEEITPPPPSIEHPVNTPGFEISKASNPTTGTDVDPGSIITYTVTGVNTGQTALNTVDIADDMTQVLAHAKYNNDAVASSGGADTGDVLVSGTDLSWTGSLAVGETVTITYSVTVNGDAGGALLKNTVNATATPPGGETITPPPVTTEHPVNTPGFEITKSADPATGTAVDPGSVITYTVTGVNTGETAFTTVDIADDMTQVLAHATYNGDASATTGSLSITGTALAWTGSLAVDQSVTITYTVTVNGDAGGEILENTVTATATPPGGEKITPPPVTTEHPVNLPGFSLSKASDPAPGIAIDPGSVVTYTVTGVNTGETALNTVDITDDMTDVLANANYNHDAVASIGGDVLVAGTDLSWTGSLAVGETVTITYSVTVNGDAGGALLKNTVNATATPPGGEEITPPPPSLEHPVNTPGFEISKAVSPITGTAVDPGSILTYTVTGVNTGETALNTVDIADDMSQVLAHAVYNDDAVASIGGADARDVVVSGTDLSWTGSLAVGETVTITYSVTVNGNAGGKILKNTVNATATPPGGEEITPPPVATENPVNLPGFSLSKASDPAPGTAIDPGSVITYTVTGVNTGETALNTVDIADDMSQVLAHAVYNDDAVASIGDADGGNVLVSGTDLSWTGALAVGETVTITYSVTVNGNAGGEILKNTVNATATPPGGEEFTPPPVATENPVNLPGFSLSKASDPAPGTAIDPGSVITYTVTGVNTGETALNTVDIADDMSQVLAHAVYNDDAVASIGDADGGNVLVAGTDLSWTGSLAVGETVTITYSVTVNGNAGGEILKNTVNATATPPGGEEITPPPPSIEHPVNLPGFEITKAVSPATGTAVDPGSILTYTVTGVNTGATALETVDITDDMSQVLAHAVYNDDAVASIGGADGGKILVAGTDLAWTGALAIGETVTITYSVTVNGNAGGEILKNTVNATATPPGGEEITPPPATTENPVNTPGFEFSKSANPKSGSFVAEGSTVVYTLNGVNTGETALNTVKISDDLTEVLKYSKYKNDVVAKVGDRVVNAPVVGQNQLTWTGDLAVGETITITYSVRVNDDANGKTLKNVAVASATPPGGSEITPPPSSTVHPIKTRLAVTGAQAMPLLVLLGAGLVSGGGVLLAMRRRKAAN